ncbi:MAG: lamin tail domain-containing protein [Bacteroidia bacterium]|nr:lamin tail domain-containing protein [Bacteroidia bacterium]
MKDLDVFLKTWLVLLCSMFLQCVPDTYSNDALRPCEPEAGMKWKMTDLNALASEEPSQITDEAYVEGWVISSDQAGNFFNELWLQDELSDPQTGIKIVMEQRDTYVRYPVGTRLFISLKGLWIRKKYGLCEVGSVQSLFGNQSIGRIPFHQLTSHIKAACSDPAEVAPAIVSLTHIEETQLNSLIRVENVEFEFDEIGKTLAIEKEETERIITDCLGNEMRILTSGYSDFYQDLIPDTHGQITGILMADRQGFYIKVREATDIILKNERCLIPIEPKTSDQILITEIADPDNAAEGRFLELYNNGESAFNLEGWRLVRYTNANLEVGSVFELSGQEIQAKSALVIAAKGPEFEAIYGFAPDAIAGTNSPADSNGDDNLALLDPFDELIDLFGVIGEDGSGTDHEFEDGKAVRNPDIHSPNAVFFSNEWTIFNDSGPPGTIQIPQQAPADFNPGVRN